MAANDKKPLVFFDVKIGDEEVGRIIFKLFYDVCPKTAENFRALCTGDKGNAAKSGKPLHFKGSIFHRIIAKLLVQGGDFTKHDGTGGESIYGEYFEDENFELKHDKPFLLSMANSGPNTNGSQFFITTVPCPHFDGKHVVFGKVVKGIAVVKRLEDCEKDEEKPTEKCVIENCGELDPNEDISTAVNDGTGDLYPEIPDEADINFKEMKEVSAVAEKIKAIGNEQFKLQKYDIALKKYKKALTYLYHDQDSESDSDDESDTETNENQLIYKQIALYCYLNSAACNLKLGKSAEVLDDCDEALDIDAKSVKALFRRAQAYSNMKEFDLAVKDLQAAIEIAPEDKAIRGEMGRIKKSLQAQRQKEKQIYSKLFSS